jgi:hypothetical protein
MLFMTAPQLCVVMCFLVLTACNVTRVEQLPQWPTATTVRALQSTLVPTFDRQYRDVPTIESDTIAPDACQPNVDEPGTSHTVTADIDYAQRTAMVVQAIRYENRTDLSLLRLILNVEPNIWPGAFTLNSVMLGAANANFELTGRRLSVELLPALEPGCSVVLELTFRLVVPHIGDGLNAYKGFFGYSPRQLNLGHWLPTMAVRLNNDWVTREAIAIGEQEVLDAADWDVTVNVSAALNSLRIAAPGEMTELAPLSWRFVHRNARDFSLSMSETFNIAARELDSGVNIELYSFNDAIIQTEQGTIDGPAYALDVASQSLGLYQDVYGPYPHDRMVVVQADLPDGMEFSGLVFVGGEYFRGYVGDPASYLMIITAHEISHQWWYGKVGNDQALSPWLDEALATYSEYVFVEEYYPELTEWWWWFRVDRLEPEGYVDSTVYEFPTIRAYINAVYLRGVRMLHALRADLGTEAFFDWLHRYADAGSGRLVTPEFFWSLLTPDQWQQIAATRQTYLRQPQVVYLQNP